MCAALERLLSDPGNRPVFDDWRRSVAISETISSLIRFDEGAIRAVEFSQGFRAFGGSFDAAYDGMPLNGAIGEDADAQFERLLDRGLFTGDAAAAISVWSTLANGQPVFLRSKSVPVRDDWGAWHVHSSHRLIDEAQNCAVKESERDTVVMPNGDEVRF
jgi:hypothetical protein